MNATKMITDILAACGCNPTITTGDGSDIVKINAPILNNEENNEND